MTVEYISGMSPQSARIPSPVNIVNVVATLSPKYPPFTSPPRVYIVGAHYDSRVTNVMDSTSTAPGADDDGSGTALVLELARVLSKHDLKAVVKFILYAGEEQGLFGSTLVAERAVQENWNIGGVFNNDIVGGTKNGNGRSEDSYVRVFSQSYARADSGPVMRQDISLGYDNDGRSRSLARYIEETDYRYKKDLPNSFGVRLIYRLDRFLRGGDQTPFHNAGFAAVRFTEANENFNHQHQDVRTENGVDYGDLPKFVDYDYCSNVARVNAAAIASLALAPDPPQDVRLVNKDLAYDSQITWRKSDDPDLVGYYVRWRATTSSIWEHAQLVKDSTVTIPISKDDVLFSVQSADKNGDLSIYVLPTPGK
jgi:Zn-dependent M28 family amino/carboxypeptidase